MVTVLTVLAVWFAVSVPAGVLIGKMIAAGAREDETWRS